MRAQSKSESFDIELAGRTFRAQIHRGKRSSSDTLWLHDHDRSYVLRKVSWISDGRYEVMVEGTDQPLMHQSRPLQVFWMGEIIEEVLR